MGSRCRVPVLALAGLFAATAIAACGEENGERFANKRIVEALGLEEADSSYAIGGDPFCIVESKLLNDADEVDAARGEAPVLASAAGNVGIQPMPPFASDCKSEARKRLNRLDPKPKGD